MHCRGVEIPLQAVLFDLDGTLIDSRMDIAAAANAVRVHYKLAPLPLDTIQSYIGRGIEHLLKLTLGDEATPDRLKEGLQILMGHYDGHLVDHTTVYPGVRDVLTLLKDRGVPMGVVSNKPHVLTLKTLELLGLKNFFGAAMGADATPNKKPHPEPLITALKLLKAEPAGSVMVGDSLVDAQAGRAAGMKVALVAHGYTHKSELLAADQDWVVDTMRELSDILS